MDLIHPRTAADVADALRDAGASGRRVLIVGTRHHLDKGNHAEVDAELWTTQLDEVVAYDPAEMLVVVQAGMRYGDLAALLAEHGQEWPADAPPGATVGGVIASGSSSARRLRVGPLRDTVVEMHLVTGDGRALKSGARTVKNVSGYDVHRLASGSLGTLGVITQVALKVRPLPERSITFVVPGDVVLADRLAAEPALASGVVATPSSVEVRIEGWTEEVDELSAMVLELAPGAGETDARFPSSPWWSWSEPATIVEAAVAPSRLAEVVRAEHRFAALAGVGIAWIAVDSHAELADLRRRVEAAGGIAPAIRGSGGLGSASPAGADVHRRLKRAFDPAGILAPGREWGAGASIGPGVVTAW